MNLRMELNNKSTRVSKLKLNGQQKINGISSTVFCVHRAVIVSLNEWNFSFGSQLKTIFHR
jgi:hypothetical protein